MKKYCFKVVVLSNLAMLSGCNIAGQGVPDFIDGMSITCVDDYSQIISGTIDRPYMLAAVGHDKTKVTFNGDMVTQTYPTDITVSYKLEKARNSDGFIELQYAVIDDDDIEYLTLLTSPQHQYITIFSSEFMADTSRGRVRVTRWNCS